MSDYGGDDYDDDYGDDWLYVEDEFMQADDLAEHAVASPPPTAYDEDKLEEWDRFDYFNDIEYGDEGYDDANFVPHNGETGQPKIGQKRKRRDTAGPRTKKQRMTNGDGRPTMDVAWLSNAPIVWRAQSNRGAKTRPLPEDAEPYAVLKDWRQTLDKVPDWVKKSSAAATQRGTGTSPQGELTSAGDEAHAAGEEDDWEDEEAMDEVEGEDGEFEEDEEEEAASIDPAAIMAALQSRLASAGGPLSGMDPQQLLQFALRMANGEGEGIDIAGEMADEILNQGGEGVGDEEAETNLLSWVTQQRDANTNKAPNATGTLSTISSSVARDQQRPLTPPSSQAKRSAKTTDETMTDADLESSNATAFEQNDTIEVEQSLRSLEKRVTGSYAAPTAASQVKAGAAKATRNGRVRR
ncbi:hypothetical protein BU23DRAFT_473215 [Bimuria novae-zelandiae CBS 107.79]|uniref:Uncharacterized protein n=1 Tax=Bimuria novae-zelandiae CBS 107.79 TaxID=1447943 RepID=A0A6A5V0C5_9PLEO|nr:hypothetical protein BU23DRAFT_473215 [Bimuria novae-zelandiae CBS 107.79]